MERVRDLFTSRLLQIKLLRSLTVTPVAYTRTCDIVRQKIVGNMALSLLLVSRSRNRAAGGALRAAKRDLAVPPAATGSLVCAHAQCHSLPIAHLQYTVRYTLAFF